eukprot:1053308-Amphidinium_carterae.1
MEKHFPSWEGFVGNGDGTLSDVGIFGNGNQKTIGHLSGAETITKNITQSFPKMYDYLQDRLPLCSFPTIGKETIA